MLDKMPSIFVSVFTVSVVFAHLCAGHYYRACEVNSELRPCGSLCEPTCENPEQRFCTPADKELCKNECRCLDGFVRNTETGQCCIIEHCPAIKRPKRCSAHEHLALCGRNCEPTCSNPNINSKSCSRMKCTWHTLACRCKEGRVRNTLTGECCRVEDCPLVQPQPQCSAHEHFALCGRNCEPTCQNPNVDSTSCPKEECTEHTQACRCKEGRVRNTLTGECCRVEDCPVVQPQPQCSAHEHFALCGRNCEPTCQNPNVDSTSCPKEECTEHTQACRCKEGRVRNTLTGECCRVEDCPVVKPQPQCSAHEHFALCGRNCEPTCQNPNVDSTSCPKDECTEHTQACRCKEGRVRNTLTGECCRVEDCPVVKPQPQCSAHEHFALCGRNCEPTCQNPNVNSTSCPKEECTEHTQACRCKEGRVRNTLTGECCRVEDCPVVQPQPQCSAHEHFALCGRNCEPTCQNPNLDSTSCPKEECTEHTQACRCKEGRVRNTLTGECCRVEDCPVLKPQPQCSAHEHFALCGRNCEPTCQNPNVNSTSCPKEECTEHTQACRCKEGRVRNTLTGECCRVEDCPVVQPQPQCSAHEHFALCGRNCEPTCQNPNVNSTSCPKEECTEHTQACRCKEGRVRNTLTGECCRVEDCPVVQPQPQCSAHEHFALCGRNCEPTCQNPNVNSTSCPKEECTEHTQACRCKEGRVRNTLTGECCRVEDCPVVQPQPQCSAHEHFALCGRNCEPTCQNPNLDSTSCPKEECTEHTQACRCKEGRVRNTLTGECCRVEDCPVVQPQPQCSAHEHFALCGRNCEPTCQNPNVNSTSCPKEECTEHTQACRCKEGRVRNTLTGECCRVEDCPVVKPQPQCSAHEHFALCGRNCEPTCQNPNVNSTSCPKEECTEHTQACRCKEGRVRNTLTGECCRVEDCPVVQPQPQCSAHEHFALCGRNCEPTCQNPNVNSTSCPKEECTEHTQACRCKEGRVRNTLTGECCRVEDCPVVQPQPQCSAHEHFALCGRNCEPTCQNPNVDSTSCLKEECTEHTQACRCKEGRVRNTLTGECCRVEDCPVVQPQPQCSAHEHFALCGRNCEPTCQNPNVNSTSCPKEECTEHTQACRCKEGRVRNTLTGECCRVEDCPVVQPQPQCSAHEHFALCGRNCEPTCENQKLNLTSCPSTECNKHTEACRCMDGHVRNVKTGHCVRAEDCPKPPPKCAVNEHLALCGRNCEPTCENQKLNLTSCPSKECNKHTEACRCMDGHVRNAKTGQCVRVDACPKPPPKCAANEHFALCGRNCEPTCENQKPDPMSCPSKECNKHTEACRCMDGQVRNVNTGQCVRAEDCPKPPPKCAANEHLALCGRNCEPTCENQKLNLTSCPSKECNKHTEACRCMDGHVRNAKTGQCVRVDACPKPPPKCAANEHFALCGRNCEPTCENQKPDPMSCPRKECNKHTEACRCMDGQVRNVKTGQCVRAEDCPKPPPKCAANEHLALCGRNCEPTCENQKLNLTSCPSKECNKHTEACRCMDGQVRNVKTGQCVRAEDCPKPPPKCTANEHLALCGRNCEPTCENQKLNLTSCPSKECNKHTEACRCMDGHVRNAKTGQCVRVDACPKPPPKCAANEQFALCGRNCEPTCENQKPDPMSCPRKECNKHTEACRCMDGQVRNVKTGQCVRAEDCPKPPPKCAANEHLALCGRNCEPTCENQKLNLTSCPSKECNKHTEACRCMDGHVRNAKTGQCVRVDACPKPPPKCAANEHFALCGRNCEPTCEHQNPERMPCHNKECNKHTEGCRCMDGHVRNIETGECVRVDNCPKPPPKCAANEVFVPCGRNNEPTCENQKPDSMFCTSKECTKDTQACRCVEGLVRNLETGQCVRIDDCPKPPPKCTIANEHFALCGRNCEPTCEHQKPELMSCHTNECNKHTEGCRCMDGHVRNVETGECVRVDDCPKSPPQCAANEHLALCGRNCEPSCRNPNRNATSCPTIACTQSTRACRCKHGYVRNEQTGNCVEVDHCPVVEPPPKCSANEHFALCGRYCEPNCKNPHRHVMSCPITSCTRSTQACRCMEGYVRNRKTGQCVRAEDCPRVGPPQKCSPNEHFALCGRHCEPNCGNPHRNSSSCPKIACTQATQACRCLDGYVRNRKTRQCVRVEHCPMIRHHRCSDNEHLALCGRNCEPSCRNPNQNSTACLRKECTEHTQACRCNKGYVRDGITMKCVRQEECAVCRRNEQIGRRGKICEATCNNRDEARCTAVGCAGYPCQCKPGFFRNEETNMCVPVERCPQKCGAGEILAPCGSLCEATCARPSIPEMCKYMKCPTRGCRCDFDAGFVLDEDTGTCIRKEECSCKEQYN